MGKFSASVRQHADMTKSELRWVAAEAIQDVVQAAQTPQPSVKVTGGSFEIGKIPVDTSDLIKSLESRINGGAVGAGEASYSVAIAGFEVGDALEFAWVSDHALPMEHGFAHTNGKQVAGRQFVGANAERFSEFVETRANEVRAKR